MNVVVAGKHALPQGLTMEEAVVHCRRNESWHLARGQQRQMPPGEPTW